MTRELIIDASATEIKVALTENKRLVELQTERSCDEFSVGDFYVGKIRKVIPGLNAAFVDVGHEKDAFLHYLDLGPQILTLNKFIKEAIAGHKPSVEFFRMEEDIPKTGKISSVLSSGQTILVQIAKEPISTKGPRITTELSIAGRYLVLVPFTNRISVSQKIRNLSEKTRLKKLAQSLKPENFGLIIRTVAEDKSFSELKADIDELLQKWESMISRLPHVTPPKKVLGEMDRSLALIRDILNDSFNSIVTNSEKLFGEISGYLRSIAPDKAEIVKLYKGKAPIFESQGIEKQIRTLFGKKVTLKSGAYLIIERTEAFHVIDVNSGFKTDSEKNQEANALETNLEVAEEVARQMRLRDLGGIIVIDFIDMHEGKNRRMLFDKLRDELKPDRARHTILPPSKFGLVQVTRQRVRPETVVEVNEKCPVCEGSGQMKSNILIIDDIENTLTYLFREQNEREIKLLLSPFVYAFVTKGLFTSVIKRWRKKFKKKISVESVSNFHFLEYHFYNSAGEEISM